jgi:cytochrome c5
MKTIKSLVSVCFIASIAAASVIHAGVGDDQIVERIKPAGKVCVAGEKCEGVQIAAATVSAGGAARSGEEITNTKCNVCHGTGAAGAPKVGDAAAWKPRIAKGVDTLVKNAISGINAMPPKGTCADCSDAEIKSAVEYMVNKSK